jgi:DNA recombination protein RmuC
MDFNEFYHAYDVWVIGAGTASVVMLAAWLIARAYVSGYVAMLTDKVQQYTQLEAQYNITQANYKVLEQDNQSLQNDKAGLYADNKHLVNRNDELKIDITELKGVISELQNEIQTLKTTNAEIMTQAHEKEQSFKEQLSLLEENKRILKTEFENLSNEILSKKAQTFKETNQEAMQHLLTPVQSELKAFKEKMETLHNQETQQRAGLKKELEQLQKLNADITDQAHKLTTALKGEKKVQGNWGELMLENILDNAGLRLGKDYRREVTLVGEEGKFRPDAIVYLPQNKHLVIDAKTSFNAYTTYVNSEDEYERATALKDHVAAVRARLMELANKDYYKLENINSPEVVIMFLPIESAYVEALKADESLFQTALDNNILIATPTTLLTSLNIVRQLWRFEEQNKHTAELASRAEKFYSKLNTFLGSMDSVGKQLDKAKDTYEKAYGQLYKGKGNLIKQAAEFKDLGVSVQKEFPETLVERAKLELDAPRQDETPKLDSHSDNNLDVTPPNIESRG